MWILVGVSAPVRVHAEDDFGVEAVDPDLPNKIKKWNADCNACHSEEGERHPPRADMDLTKLAKLAIVPPERFEQSVHGKMACKECHGDPYVTYPHGADARKGIQSCPDCHKALARDVTPQLQSSIHFKLHGEQFKCTSCHNPHVWQKVSKIASPQRIAAQDNAMCLNCHESDLKYAAFTVKKRRPVLTEVHSWLPNAELHWKHVRCIDCHTPAKTEAISHELLPKTEANRNCVVCHSADSSLRTRLYRYLVDQQQERLEKAGFVNAFILNEAYVVGATRNKWVDLGSAVVVGLLLAGLAGHGLIRIVTTQIRNRRK